ncbi:DUF4259 domain-containing protein [Microtetraspora sp. NBRC 16547]|uniref:DUF4259 domain-containing protein n=1 Tax=Microtetraspora sp. NBRC 16547 TaxID=3030993 RepID=UPI0024A354C0|nr:DUF4259 domain-containing protein [Microtetraspora sp. NBRC 16547]GLX02998.1 hypothetical protein Misp02_70840 [Microtetraspora sp. NBRC 16547]
MGAWGTGPLDNDAAGDLLDELGQARPEDLPDLLRSKFGCVIGVEGGLDSWEAEQALAGAVLVAYRLAEQRGHPLEIDEDLEPIQLEVPEELRDQAERTVRRALMPDDNEWYHLWTLSDGIDEAKSELEPYLRILSA